MSRERENLQHQAEHTRSRRRSPNIAIYLVVLFAVAFLLLLMAYFQQRRQSDQTSDALKQSVSAVESIQNLMDDNDSLREQVETLKEQLSQAQGQAEDLEQANRQLTDTVEQTRRALDYFWQVDEAYVRGRYGLCRDLIQAVEEQGLKAWLPTESVTDTDRFSPADRYQEIYDALY